jgi:uncharacterized repeat protein (TIGR02543 family)
MILCTDNREAIRIEWAQNTLVQNCVINDYEQINNWHNIGAIKMYHTKYTTIENCEIFNCSSGVYDKSDGEFTTIRNNYIHNTSLPITNYSYYKAATEWTPAFYSSHHDMTIYNNVIAFSSSQSIYEDVGGVPGEEGVGSDRLSIYNNTFYTGNAKSVSVNLNAGVEKMFYNNIIYGLKKDTDIGLLRFYRRSEANGRPVTIALCDYNQYGGISGNFLIKIRKYINSVGSWSIYSSLTAWQSSGELIGGGNPDLHSFDSDPQFLNSSGTMTELDDFRLASDSPCIGTGMNGVNMGADIDLVGVMSGNIISGVDKAALTAAITAEIGADHGNPGYILTASDYTAESWAAYTAAVGAAITVEGDEEATQGEVGAAIAAIASAKEGLEFAGAMALTVTFESNGGSEVSGVSIQQGSLLTKPADSVKSGYIFAGWFKNAELTEEWDFALDVVTVSITLYAKWVEDINVYYVSPDATSTNWAAAKNNINAPCTVATAMANAIAGDTVYFLEGTYNTVPASPPSGENPGNYQHYRAKWEPKHSGTASAPITFAAYPGAEVIINGILPGEIIADNSSPDMIRVFSTGRQDHIIFDGFIIQATDGAGGQKLGSIIIGYDIANWDNSSNYCIIRNCIFKGLDTPILTTDNREAIRIEYAQHTLVQNCYLQNIRQPINWQNTGAIKMYDTKYTTVENCEIFNCTSSIYDKRNSEFSTFRNNYINNCNDGIHITGYGPNNRSNHDDLTIYNNVIINSNHCSIWNECQDDSHSDRMTIYNNTFYTGNAPGVSVQTWGGTEKRYYNNIIQGKRISDYEGVLKFFVRTNSIAVPVEIAECDYNQYGNLDFLIRSKLKYTGDPTPTIDYNTLSAWQSSTELADGGHPDVNSLASDPMFENASGTMQKLNDFRLAQGSPCLGVGKGGVDMGADIDLVGFNLPGYTRRTVVFYSVDCTGKNNGYQSAIIADVEHGSLLAKPDDPVKEGSIFEGWYTSRDLATKWDFANDSVEANMALFARWSGAAQSVNITEDSIKFDDIGAVGTFTATVLPGDAINKEVEWSSSNTAVATVDTNGTVTAIGEGTATITAKVAGSEIKDTCTVTVEQITRITFTAPQSVAKHQTFTVTIGLKTLKQILSADMGISYDKHLVKYEGYQEVEGGLLVAGRDDRDQGHESVRFILTGRGAEDAISGTEDVHLIELTFTARKDIADFNAVNVVRATLVDTQRNILLPTLPNGAAPVSIAGDLNFDGVISIADIEIACVYFGKTTESPDWDTAKIADISQDGKVDMNDLAAISRKIFK